MRNKAKETLLKHINKGATERKKKFNKLVNYDIFIDAMIEFSSNNLNEFQKNRKDILNEAKSKLKEEENTKIGKTMTPYRSEKIIFLRKIIKWIEG